MDDFWARPIAQFAPVLEIARTGIIDRTACSISPEFLAKVGLGAPQILDLNEIPVGLVGSFEIGPGFDADGYIFVSTRTFFQIFPQQDPGAPSHVFVKIADGADTLQVREEFRAQYSATGTRTRTLDGALADEVRVQTVEAPFGIIFGFDALMGVFVGLVIFYQVLTTEVSDHIREYATMKAIGYKDRFFSSIVLEQAAILGIAGFVPGAVLATFLYGMISGATGLPMVMEAGRLTFVLCGTLIACTLSGLLASRKLASAEPAELC